MKEIMPFYKFKAEAGDEPAGAELLIFDVIGDWEELGELGAKAFAKDLSALPKSIKRLDIHINSPGGSVSEAMAIYSRLADHRSDKNVYIDGLAASAATLVAMVGHKIFVRSNATMMIHLPIALAIGNADEMRKTISALDSVTESMLNLYAKRTGGDRDAIRALMAGETWMTAQVAVDKGFADEVRGVVKAAAVVRGKHVMFNGLTFDLSRFNNVPAFNATTEEPNPMETKPAATTETPPPATKPGEKPPTTTTPPGTPAPPQPAPPPEKPAASYEDGIKAERARIAALQGYDRKATHDIVVKAIADGKTLAEVMPELFAAMEKAGQQQARREDGSLLNTIEGGDALASGGTEGDFGSRLVAAVDKQLKARRELFPLHSRN
jgi:ATP-dependent protease ClpP protease subunit